MRPCAVVSKFFKLSSNEKNKIRPCGLINPKCGRTRLAWWHYNPPLSVDRFLIFSFGLQGPENACTILDVRVGSTSVYVEQDTADRNLLGKYNLQS